MPFHHDGSVLLFEYFYLLVYELSKPTLTFVFIWEYHERGVGNGM